MRTIFMLFNVLISASCVAQELSIFDGRSWGIVLEHPEMKNVIVKQDVPYLSDQKGILKMDVYLPPGLQSSEKRPTIVFLNAIGDNPGEMKVKSWGTYKSWPTLVAANGYVGISMECDRTRVQESLQGIFSFLSLQASTLNIDANRLGVYAASANVTQATSYLMSSNAYAGIKAAVLYYGRQPEGPYRKDLPVLFVLPEGDVGPNGYATLWNEVLKNKAPWTIKMGSGLIHGFDTFNDNDDSRKIIKETISFWKNQLDPIPVHSWPNSIGRETLAAQYGHDESKAAKLLKTWVDEHQNDGRAFFQYGSTLKNLKRYTEAEAALQKAASLQPENAYAKSDLIAVYYALNKEEEALKLFELASKAGQVNRNVYANVAFSLFILNKHLEGVQYFEKILPSERMPWDYYNLGCGYARLNKKDKAYTALNKAVELGYNSKQQYENDDDLISLRTDKQYQELLNKLK